ncbi:MAG: hypothetical protein U1A72_22555, partial [Sulfuritalea sp.]|nr:hypothetical protein [Sulfuritalea sp.]
TADITQKALDILGLSVPGSVTGPTAGPVGLNGTPALKPAVTAGMIAPGASYDVDGPLTFTGTAQGSNFTASGQTLTGAVTGLGLNGTGAGNYTLTGAAVSVAVTSPPSTTTTRPATTTTRVAPTTSAPTTSPQIIRQQQEQAKTEATVTVTEPTQERIQPGETRQIVVDTGDVTFDVEETPAVFLSEAGDTTTAQPQITVTINAETGELVVDVVVPRDTPAGIYTATITAVDSRGQTRTLVYLFLVGARGQHQ